MKNLFLILLFCSFYITVDATIINSFTGTVTSKNIGYYSSFDGTISGKIEEGETIQFTCNEIYTYLADIRIPININESIFYIKGFDLNAIQFNKETMSLWQYWQYIKITNTSNRSFIYKEDVKKLRHELDTDASAFLSAMRDKSRVYRDNFLEVYIQRCALEIIESRPELFITGDLSISILHDPTPNAFVFSNGYIFVTTGLLGTIQGEMELKAVLAHELAHLILYHSESNILAAERRQRNADFWTGLVTIGAAAIEGYASYKYDIPYTGVGTISAAVLTYGISQSIIKELGKEYSIAQEQEADKVACMIMEHMGIPKNALASTLQRLANQNTIIGLESVNYLESTHPSIKSRISRITNFVNPDNFIEKSYQIKTSSIISLNAISMLWSKKYSDCLRLSRINIENKVGLPVDYISAAISLCNLTIIDTDLELAKKYFNIALEMDASEQEKAICFKYLSIICYHQNIIFNSLKYLDSFDASASDSEVDMRWSRRFRLIVGASTE